MKIIKRGLGVEISGSSRGARHERMMEDIGGDSIMPNPLLDAQVAAGQAAGQLIASRLLSGKKKPDPPSKLELAQQRVAQGMAAAKAKEDAQMAKEIKEHNEFMASEAARNKK